LESCSSADQNTTQTITEEICAAADPPVDLPPFGGSPMTSSVNKSHTSLIIGGSLVGVFGTLFLATAAYVIYRTKLKGKKRSVSV
jgi:hypothetical protein